jgi:hypothetical protein
MKKLWVAALLLLVTVVLVSLYPWKKAPSSSENNNSSPSSGNTVTNAASNVITTAADATPGIGLPSVSTLPQAGELPPPQPVDTNVPPIMILQNARRAIVQYAQVYGGNPVGVNSEITAQLMGDNPKHINFITPDSGLQINDKGEMIDAWGTPLFFHQLSGHEMEIHSAGPDRKMWTFDDLVTK